MKNNDGLEKRVYHRVLRLSQITKPNVHLSKNLENINYYI